MGASAGHLSNVATEPYEDTEVIRYCSVEQALALIRQRRQDQGLIREIVAFLHDDIPDYLTRHDCFVLSRHIATPNYEALYVLNQAKRLGWTVLFSQDLSDRFTSVNNMKRRLARPDVRMLDDTGNATFRKVDLVDVPGAEGRIIRDIRCKDGRLLHEFHNRLFERIADEGFLIEDDAEWTDRNWRSEMKLYYERYLTLFLAHGILFEEYESTDDRRFKKLVAIPIIRKLVEKFGFYPLIVRPHPAGIDPDDRLLLSHREGLL